ncbi:hypothetical protein ACIQ7N_03305 [Lysinibacillus sp. NPDC095746]|uniref:hypothetical protein n=1 Tax=Lysinibacillus sp. NPDC095746 TaxID=3364134 RepID=UPI00382D1BE5
MNILISCLGRRVEMLEVFNREFAKFNMGIIATGNSNILPALNDVKAILTMLDKDKWFSLKILINL